MKQALSSLLLIDIFAVTALTLVRYQGHPLSSLQQSPNKWSFFYCTSQIFLILYDKESSVLTLARKFFNVVALNQTSVKFCSIYSGIWSLLCHRLSRRQFILLLNWWILSLMLFSRHMSASGRTYDCCFTPLTNSSPLLRGCIL